MAEYQKRNLLSQKDFRPAQRSGLLYSRNQASRNDKHENFFGGDSKMDQISLSIPEIKQSTEGKPSTSYNDLSNSNSSESGNGKVVEIVNTTLTITDGYGMRTFKGREGKHSTGVDYTTNNQKAVAITDGVIEDVRMQHGGRKYKPDAKGPDGKQLPGSAGYYLIVRNSDGTKSQYMHLDPMTKDEMSSLKGKTIKRGDEIWGYGTGSGSMTGPHVKYRVYTGSSGSKSHINPLKYILQ